MAQVLRLAMRGGIVDDLAALGNGFIDGILLSARTGNWGPIVFLAKNIAVPVIHYLVSPLPKGLVHSSEGMLGFAISVLIMGATR